jgi:hypothetical protein
MAKMIVSRRTVAGLLSRGYSIQRTYASGRMAQCLRHISTCELYAMTIAIEACSSTDSKLG